MQSGATAADMLTGRVDTSAARSLARSRKLSDSIFACSDGLVA